MKFIRNFLFGIIVLCPVLVVSETIKVPSQYLTIQEAINAAQNGDTILVADGVYNEEINFNGYGADSVIIKSELGPDNCIIDCENGSWAIGFVFNSEDCKSTVEGFTIKNALMGIWAYANSSPTIKNNVIDSCEVGIYCSSDANPLITSNIIKNCVNGEEGYSAFGGGISIRWSSAVVTNNIIINNSARKGGGIYCKNSSPSIINNTIVWNSEIEGDAIGGGIYIEDSSPDIVNNIIAFSDGTGIITVGSSSLPNILYNDIYENGGGNYLVGSTSETAIIVDLKGVDGNISGDPLFYGNDYSLTFGSPCVDAGTPDTTGLNIGVIDFNGNPRLYDGNSDGNAVIDMGAVELQISSGENSEFISICQGEEYEGHTENGMFQRTLTSATGSDSIVTTYLTVNPSYNIQEDVTICEGEDYFGYSVEGEYTREFKTNHDCDSIIITTLSVRPVGNCYLTLKVPSEYPTIQSAMDAANPGDIVEVADGTYTGEGNLYLDFYGKAITVKSENGPENCIIDCVEGTG
ncbi:MAG: right-handed parallel beta-helix repeat-containing protein, partial [Mariniphaga sp.]|nr:right-handed parallel beta-helix repeat-containing protein [Mariniphaga sp.]